jgi:ATP-dependent RNA helicase DDX27
MRTAEMELKKGQNMINHEEEIFGRPKRTWFQTEKEKEKSASKFVFVVQPIYAEPGYSDQQAAIRERVYLQRGP